MKTAHDPAPSRPGPGPTPSPFASRAVILLVILLTVGGPLVAAATVWPTYATDCGNVVAPLTAILREVLRQPPEGLPLRAPPPKSRARQGPLGTADQPL